MPCCHALAAIYHCGLKLSDPFNFIPSWFQPIYLLQAYEYIEESINEHGETVICYIGLRAIDITELEASSGALGGAIGLGEDEDPFADLVVEPPVIPKKKGRKGKRRQAGDGKGPLHKHQKPQTCKVCGEQGHNRLTCTKLTELEGGAPGMGII